MDSFEQQKQERRKENKALKKYLRGWAPTTIKGVALFLDGSRYLITPQGWRRLPKEI